MIEWKDKFVEAVLDKLIENGTAFKIFHQNKPVTVRHIETPLDERKWKNE